MNTKTIINQKPRFLDGVISGTKVFGIIPILHKIHGTKGSEALKQELIKYPDGTIGKDLVNMVINKNLDFIPKFESHDLKHFILGYGMNAEDEIKMQAFLLGNGNYTIPCLLFVSLGVLMPDKWTCIKDAFKRGIRVPSILKLKIEDVAHLPTLELKRKFQ